MPKKRNVLAALVLLTAVYTWLPDAARESGWFTCSLFAPTPDGITWSNSNWQEIAEGSLFILSAYEDRRFQPHYVRIMGMESINLSAGKLTCVLWYVGGRRDVVAATRLRMWVGKNNINQDGHIKHVGYVYSCAVPGERESSPSHVSLTFDVCEQITNAMKVMPYIPTDRMQNHDHQRDSNDNTAPSSGKIALCLKPMNFPTKDIALRLAEWIEIQRLQGVDVIFTYVYDVTDTAMMVLHQYQQRNIVDFVIATLPGLLPNDRKNRTAFLRRTDMQMQLIEKIMLNDCFYRHLAYDYVINLDLDEVIVPRQHLTWKQMIPELSDVSKIHDPPTEDDVAYIMQLISEAEKEIAAAPPKRTFAKIPDRTDYFDKDRESNSTDATCGRPVDEESQLAPPCASYCFRQSMFLDEFHQQDHDDIPEYLHVMQHTNRSMYVLDNTQIFLKCLFSSDAVLVLGNHIAYHVQPGYDDTCHADQKMALIHHYRHNCKLYQENRKRECDKTLNNTIQEDRTLWKYLDPVRQAVHQMALTLNMNTE
ncbi:PREDICTED: uncharacterized protein LOC106817585 [Priapulus caudatus]|uniref:Glycosyltransferase family 92 protein n=1 Tax=Priapulus caudatus TaxID=37621 RepID=A0ABM1EZX8_PRICU|nr:PREDICTED: uncharacterized protein LOC106817585 [Priapulus caudatus]XP_014677750.1 PREDICTED: uncharacterized protein LOC106817585 [Priapulus caudatus]